MYDCCVSRLNEAGDLSACWLVLLSNYPTYSMADVEVLWSDVAETLHHTLILDFAQCLVRMMLLPSKRGRMIRAEENAFMGLITLPFSSLEEFQRTRYFFWENLIPLLFIDIH